MSQKVVVTYKQDYADEFDVEGFYITTLDKFEEFEEALYNHVGSIDWFFGTNEYQEWSTGQVLRDQLNIRLINSVEEIVLQKLLNGSDTFGQIPYIFDFEELDLPDLFWN